MSIVSILASAVGDLAVHAQPNLRPLPPAGWPLPLIISTRQGDRQTATEAYDDQDLYIDWAVRNTSTTAAVWGTFYYRLTVDGYKWFEWYNDYVAPGGTDRVEDHLLGRLTAGVHTVRIETDVTGVIHETNESDNAYERQLTILPRRANGHFYALTTKAGTWHQAQAEATSYGGHLVTITSLSEQRFVVGAFLRNGFAAKPLWIGLTDHVQEGAYRWVTGEPFEFANWNSQEPNNCGNEDYIAINWHVAHNRSNSRLGDWNDAPAAGTAGCLSSWPEDYFGIIEWNTEPTGFPGQMFQWAGPVAEPEAVWRRAAGGNDHAYQAFWVAEGITWNEAKAFAEGRGGALASITSSSENTFVAALIQNDRFWQDRRRYGSDVSFGPWLGGYQPAGAPEPDGGWRWTTGEIFSYSNWDTHQPDNYGPNGESRLQYYQGYPPGRRDLWNDEEPDSRMGGFVVEYSGALPQISSVSPNPVEGSDVSQKITINGANFVNKPTVTLTWTGQPSYRLPNGQLAFVNANKLEMSIVTGTAADTWTVKVTNPDGRSSESYTFLVVTRELLVADGFDYPIGDRGWRNGRTTIVAEFPGAPRQLTAFSRWLYDERNHVYTNKPLAYSKVFMGRELEGFSYAGTGWRNLQDVGAYNPDSRFGGLHPGEDWNKTEDELGQPVFAVADGQVVEIKQAGSTVSGSGWAILLRHRVDYQGFPENIYSLYVHVAPAWREIQNRGLDQERKIPNSSGDLGGILAAKEAFEFQKGAIVRRGQIIARVARVSSFGPHLHFELRTNGGGLEDGGPIWPRASAGYYTHDGAKHIQGLDSEQVAQAFRLMHGEVGILDPSDFIDDHRPTLPVTYLAGDRVEAIEADVEIRKTAGGEATGKRTYIGLQATILDDQLPSMPIEGKVYRWYKVRWDSPVDEEGWIPEDFMARISAPPPHGLRVAPSIADGGQVTVMPARSSYREGERVTLIAHPAHGYFLDSWSGVDEANGLSASLTLSASRTVTANFKKQHGADGFDCPAVYASSSGSGARLAGPGEAIDLNLLRRFRDEVLSATPEGRALIDEFYQNSAEILHHMAANPAVLAGVKDTIVSLQPTIRDLVDGDGQQTLTETTVEAVSTLAQQLHRAGGVVLRSAIESELERTGPLNALTGQTSDEVRRRIVGRYLRIVQPRVVSDGFEFRVTGDVVGNLRAEYSDDLRSWTRLGDGVISQLPATVRDGNPPASGIRYYRVVSEP